MERIEHSDSKFKYLNLCFRVMSLFLQSGFTHETVVTLRQIYNCLMQGFVTFFVHKGVQVFICRYFIDQNHKVFNGYLYQQGSLNAYK